MEFTSRFSTSTARRIYTKTAFRRLKTIITPAISHRFPSDVRIQSVVLIKAVSGTSTFIRTLLNNYLCHPHYLELNCTRLVEWKLVVFLPTPQLNICVYSENSLRHQHCSKTNQLLTGYFKQACDSLLQASS